MKLFLEAEVYNCSSFGPVQPRMLTVGVRRVDWLTRRSGGGLGIAALDGAGLGGH
ncbi:hypothetical protein [Yoonia sp. SDW83-1]|uniref:hypothetical protein n=1 Tax=Yoonia sp. SDW83-1 TaxID=3366945 RepID=UPI00398C4344